MRTLKIIGSAALAVALAATTATAATFTFTEGNGQNRKLVADSVDLQDARSNAPGFDLGQSLTANDILQIHGRIVGAKDSFSYLFQMTEAFVVSFDLDGYQLAGNLIGSNGVDGFEQFSGLVGQNTRRGDPTPGADSKGVRFTLAGGGTTQSRTFQTDVLLGDDAFIFSGLGGVAYTLTVDGSVGPRKNAAALYDLKVAAIPLPATGLLLLTTLAGVGFIARRRKAV
ncbi:MAG: hypothetical protein AAFP78_01305 [Pseudomonadota bacterium]